MLNRGIALAFHRYAVVLDVGLSALAGAKDDVDGIPFGFRHIAFVEFETSVFIELPPNFILPFGGGGVAPIE